MTICLHFVTCSQRHLDPGSNILKPDPDISGYFPHLVQNLICLFTFSFDRTYSSENNPSLPYRSTIPATTVVELADEIIDKVLFKLPVQSASSSKPVIFTVKI